MTIDVAVVVVPGPLGVPLHLSLLAYFTDIAI
jgi:hypothetical protein